MLNPRSCFFLLAWLGVTAIARSQNAGPPTITTFAKPFLFAYGTWQDTARIDGGQLVLATPNAQGGLGDNLQPPLDLSPYADFAPLLRLQIEPQNQLKTLRLMLRDVGGGNATWDFALTGQKIGAALVVTPVEGASLQQPNDVGKEGPPNLSKIMQWQVMGDWSAGPVAVRVDAVQLMAPSDAIRAARTAGDKRRADEAIKLRQEHQALQAQYKPGTLLAPVVEHLAPVAPAVLAVEIHAGHVTPGHLEKYVKQAGDTTREKKLADGRIESVGLVRDGKEMGWLIGPNRDWLTTRAHFEGDPLLGFVADDKTNYIIRSTDDEAFKTPLQPLAVGRKSTPTLWAEDSADFEMRHTLYLTLPHPLAPGKHYTLNLGTLNTRTASVELAFDPATVRSEAVHVNQIGYRPDDLAKRAFVSCWLGTGGALKLPGMVDFSLVDDKSGQAVWHGQSRELWPASKDEAMQHAANFNGTDVLRLDFSAFRTPGRYRVVVAGVGASYPFEIGPDVWRHAFWVQMKGLYNQRSGVELGPPYTDFKKPRDMFPGDAGVSVTWTKNRAVEKGTFADLARGDTGKPAPGWGGYHDAGDWNPRRVTHMVVTMAQLEVFDLFPTYFAPLKLNIPPRAGVPDILTEAIFEFETFHRLQQPDGGIGYGLETQGDPVPGEVSWLQSFKIYALAPDYSSSWFYAAVGARLAYLLQPYDAGLAATYRASAMAAFGFAEKDWARDQAAITAEKRDVWQDLDGRNLAALELYRLTHDKKWHDLFLQDTVLKDPQPELFGWGKHVQRDQAFLYARLPDGLGDPALKQKASVGVREMAQRALDYASHNAFNLTTADKGKPQFIGFYSAPDATDLIHAHFLTHEEKYLAGAVQATQFQSGGNPNNVVYTSGLGAHPVQHPFKLDTRRTGQAEPIGLTPYGNVDLAKWGNQQWITWPITYFLSKNTVPDPYRWPVHEAYWDIGGWPALNEFTVDAWAPNVALWGYLAARGATKP